VDTYFDEQLYKKRVVIEQANAWLDSFKTLLIRFEVLPKTWIAFHLIAFVYYSCAGLVNSINFKQLL
jgi:hypothetical protein